MAFDRAVLYENDVVLLIIVHSTKKSYNSFLKKAFVISDSLFQSNENVQNIHWSSHENMLIFEAKGYFKNPWYCILEESLFFLLALKWNLMFREKPTHILP